MFDGGGPGRSGAQVPMVPTPRPTTVSLMTTAGPRDVSFQDYADIASDPTGSAAQAIGYVSPEALPDVSPEVEGSINEYVARNRALNEGASGYSYIDGATGERVYKSFDPVTRATNMGILGAVSRFTRNTIQDQLTTPLNYYQGSGNALGRFLTRPGADVDRYVPVTNENGMIIGSMAVDAAGNPLGYTGTQTTNATFNDPNINIEAARAMIDPFQNSGDDDNEPRPVDAAPTEPITPETPECPDGYKYDEATQSCVLDPFQQEFQQTPAYSGPYEVAGQYTAAPTVQVPALQPIGSPITIPAPTVTPITIAPQTPAGLASLNVNRP